MKFEFPDPKTIEPRKRRVQRFLEMIPGTLTWSTLIGMIVLSFFLPLWMAIFVIIFDIYWITRALYVTLFSTIAHYQVNEGKRIDWWERVQNTLQPEQFIETLSERIKSLRGAKKELPLLAWSKRRIMRREIGRTRKALRETKAILPLKQEIMDWREVIHVILLPTAGEPVEVIEPAIESLANANFPKEQMIILLATEEREDPETRLPKVEALKARFGNTFKDFLVTTHIVATGEMKCKASNAGFAARELKIYLDERGIDYKRVVFSN
ncbi:MAG: hypothetical protein AAB845_02425, partial [Patescibacteria group bacterium]